MSGAVTPQMQRDRALPYVSKVIVLSSNVAPETLEQKIEDGLSQLSERAKSSGMVMMNVTQFCNVAGEFLIYTIICQWLSQAAIEQIRREQQFGLQPATGGPRAIPRA